MEKENLILSKICKRNCTANEAIGSIFREDVKNGLLRSDWKFYNHLNKLLAPLEKKGLIVQIGSKMGPTKKMEKVWGLTEAGQAYLEQSLAA